MKPAPALSLLALALALPAWAAAPDPSPAPAPVPAPAPPPALDPDKLPVVTGKIDAVTVYRGQALVTRLVPLPGPAGLRELVVSELPEAIVPASLYAESAEGVEVRSVRYRIRPVAQDVRAEVRALDDQIRAVQDKLTANQRQQAVLASERDYMGKLEQFVAPTASVELSKGVLNAETLTRLTTFQFEQRQRLADEDLKLTFEARALQEQLNLLQRERSEIAGRSARAVREAVVLVNQAAAGGQMRLRYLVNNASWSPSYTARAEADRKAVRLEYNAAIQQLSGEDWTDVSMTLSTATPSLVATAPTLAPLTVALRPDAAPGKGVSGSEGLSLDTYERSKTDLKRQLNELAAANSGGNVVINAGNVTFVGTPGPGQAQRRAAQQPSAQQAAVQAEQQDGELLIGGQQAVDARFNRLADELQVLDLANPLTLSRKGDGRRAPRDEQTISVTYALAGRTSLPSRADRQTIQIAATALKATFYKLAIPVLTEYVYDEATVTNTGAMVLLAGPVSSYLGGEFVGLGQIPTVSVGEDLTIGFGIDTALRTARELVEKKASTQGGNRLVDFTYRLTIENFGPAPADVRLLDRLPNPAGPEVKLTLAPAGPAGKELSADPVYLQTQRKKGILRWEVQVPAQAIGPKALGVEYSFSLEYDKQMTIGGLAGEAKP